MSGYGTGRPSYGLLHVYNETFPFRVLSSFAATAVPVTAATARVALRRRSSLGRRRVSRRVTRRTTRYIVTAATSAATSTTSAAAATAAAAAASSSAVTAAVPGLRGRRTTSRCAASSSRRITLDSLRRDMIFSKLHTGALAWLSGLGTAKTIVWNSDGARCVITCASRIPSRENVKLHSSTGNSFSSPLFPLFNLNYSQDIVSLRLAQYAVTIYMIYIYHS